jgi:hypothetical protein
MSILMQGVTEWANGHDQRLTLGNMRANGVLSMAVSCRLWLQ